MKIQHLIALVVLSLPTGPGVRTAIREFKARTLALLTLACLLVAAPATAQVNYAISGGTAYVTSSPNASGATVIASTYNGYPVTSIGDAAFYGTSLTSVTIPDSVNRIGEKAFWGCTSLTSVTIPNSVTSIGLWAFYYTGLTNVIIGNSVTSIGYGAFYYCYDLTSVTIPNGVTSIGGQAFSYCFSLTNVNIGNSVTSIGYGAFSGCTSLTSLSVAAANPAYSSLNGVWFDKAQTILIMYPVGRGGSYVIPDSVTNIGEKAFYGCTSLTSVTIPNNVTSIGEVAFFGCTSLTNVIIGNSVTSIGGQAFYVCTSLTSVTIPNSVTSIGRAAFWGCTSLTNFTFLGNAPSLIPDWPVGTQFAHVGPGAKAYYCCGTTGWGATYGGLPTVMLCPPQIAPGSAGVKPGGFGFTLTCLTNQSIVVEASANLANWQPIWTNTLPGASADFVDPEWLQQSNRFYRARSD